MCLCRKRKTEEVKPVEPVAPVVEKSKKRRSCGGPHGNIRTPSGTMTATQYNAIIETPTSA